MQLGVVVSEIEFFAFYKLGVPKRAGEHLIKSWKYAGQKVVITERDERDFEQYQGDDALVDIAKGMNGLWRVQSIGHFSYHRFLGANFILKRLREPGAHSYESGGFDDILYIESRNIEALENNPDIMGINMKLDTSIIDDFYHWRFSSYAMDRPDGKNFLRY